MIYVLEPNLLILIEIGGMVYPAIAEHLVFKMGFSKTWLSIVKSIFRCKSDELTNY